MNPRLLVMDEPTEGLAPVIVAHVEEMLVRLADEGDVAILVIEQNIGVATRMADRVAIMVNGRINRDHRRRRRSPADRDLQQRLLGVGRHGHDETDGALAAAAAVPRKAARESRRPGRRGIYNVNPGACRRAGRSRPGGADRGAARTVSRPTAGDARRPARAAMCGRLRRARRASRTSSIAGTLDTKGEELRFIRDLIRPRGCATRLVDLSTVGRSPGADVSPQEVALAIRAGSAGIASGDRGTAVAGDDGGVRGLDRQRQEGVAGIISAGGSGGTAMVTAGDAGAAGRRAQAHDLDHGVGQCRCLCRRRPTSR